MPLVYRRSGSSGMNIWLAYTIHRVSYILALESWFDSRAKWFWLEKTLIEISKIITHFGVTDDVEWCCK